MAVPDTMRALVQESDYGDPADVLSLRTDYPTPKIKEGSSAVLVKVHAVSINPIDYKIIQGFMKLIAKTEFPFVPGSDLSGTVVSVGTEYKGLLKAGDRVWADNIRLGAIAEFALVPATKCHAMPSKLSFEEAAAVPLAGLTSYQALKDKGNLQPGQSVLILGGSGGTGTFALQIAKALGASQVATTSSSEELCKSCGADQVINYKKGEQFGSVLAGQNYDLVFDCVGGVDSWVQSQKVLKAGGKFVTIVGDSTDNLSVMGIAWMMSVKGWRTVKTMFGAPEYITFLTNSDKEADYTALHDLVEAGKVKPVLDSHAPYSLSNWTGAWAMLMSHRAKGKIVIKVA